MRTRTMGREGQQHALSSMLQLVRRPGFDDGVLAPGQMGPNVPAVRRPGAGTTALSGVGFGCCSGRDDLNGPEGRA